MANVCQTRPYFSDPPPWCTRWPLLRVGRYCGTFVLGLIVGGSIVRLGGQPVTTQSTAATNPECQMLSSTGQKSGAIGPAIEAPFARLVTAILTITSAINSSDQLDQLSAGAQSGSISEAILSVFRPTVANRGMVVTDTDPRPVDHNSLLLVGAARQ